jgi:hypothetical protein
MSSKDATSENATSEDEISKDEPLPVKINMYYNIILCYG